MLRFDLGCGRIQYSTDRPVLPGNLHAWPACGAYGNYLLEIPPVNSYNIIGCSKLRKRETNSIKEKKVNLLFILIVLCSLAAIAVVLFMQKTELSQNPFDNRLNFRFPYKSYIDNRNSLYVIDYNTEGYTRLVKIDEKGDVVFTLNGGERGDSGIYTAYSIALDDSFHIFLINLVPNMEDELYEREEIKHFSPAGEYIETVVRYEYGPEERNARQDYLNADLTGMRVENGNLYYYAPDSDGSFNVYKTSIKDKKTEKLYALPPDQVFGDQIGHESGGMYVNLNDGEIYRLTEEKGALRKDALDFVNRRDFPNLNPYPFQVYDGVLYFNELFSQTIMKAENNRLVPVLRFKERLKGTYGYENTLMQFFSINYKGWITAPEKNHQRILVFAPDGTLNKAIGHATYPARTLIFRIGLWAMGLLGVALLFALFRHLYIRLLKRRVSLVVKNAFIVTPIVLCGIIITSTVIYNRINGYYIQKLEDEFFILAQWGASAINGDNLQAIDSLKDINGEPYSVLKKEMKAIVNDNNDKWNEGLSVYVYKEINGVFYISDSIGYDFLYPYKVPDAYADAYEAGDIRVVRYFDETGEWMAGVSPIKNTRGEAVGLLEVSEEMNVARETENLFNRDLLLGTVVSVVAFMLIFIVITAFLLLSVRKLKRMVNEIINKNYNIEIAIKSRDEIEDLGNGFNFMAKEIRNHLSAVQDLNRANQKFVPSEFLKLLGKENITDVALGDQTANEMTVMFTDIRNFTTISEKMSPKENFNFLNSYLSRMGPIIRNNNGFIDKYIGDAIMALFPEKPDDALASAIEMQRQLRVYNGQRKSVGYEPIRIGCGIHSGNLMLGIIGEVERFDGTVISDAMNLSSRLENLTKLYNVNILTSRQTLEALAAKQSYSYRIVDRICVKGKTVPISIYEVYDCDTDEGIDLKNRTKKDLFDAINHFHQRRFRDAMTLLDKIKKINDADPLVDFYSARIMKIMKAIHA